MVKIRIKKLLLRTFIGFNPDELINKQDVVINLEIEVSIPDETLKTDNPAGIYDYKVLTKEIIAFVEGGHFKLLEVLTSKLIELIMKDERVTRVKVEVEKPFALRFAETVSCEMEAKR